jgi:hypothetical protein
LPLYQAKDWKKALQLFEEIKAIKLIPTVPMMNALITALCMCILRGKMQNIYSLATYYFLKDKIALHDPIYIAACYLCH